MNAWQPSTLTWSYSRKTHFDSCRRHYFYHRFWGQDPKLRWRLFEMRNLTTLTMLRGQVVHSVISGLLNSIKLEQKVDSQIAKQNVTDIIRTLYMESAKRLWHIENRPEGRKASEITSLIEHYYNVPNINEQAREAQRVAWQCVANLAESDMWAEIAASNPDNWQEIEGNSFPSFDIDGIQVYTRIDFAHSINNPTIIDWKTGNASEQDRRQLILYSLYAQSKWDWNPFEIKLMAVYLQPEFLIDTFTPTAEDINDVRNEVKHSFGEMLNVEPAFGPADINNFPMTGGIHDCTICRFKGICESK